MHAACMETPYGRMQPAYDRMQPVYDGKMQAACSRPPLIAIDELNGIVYKCF